MRPGHRVFIAHGNSIGFFTDLLAIWSNGGCAVPLDPKLTDFELCNLLQAAKPRYLLDTKGPGTVKKRFLDEQGVVFIRPDDEAATTDRAQTDNVNQVLAKLNAARGEALILFTSGSTGQPKGVVHTHQSLRAKWKALSSMIEAGTLHRTLCMLPTHFGHGLICNALFPWLSGFELFLVPPFSPHSIMSLGDLLTRHEITFFSSVPAIWHLALKTRSPVGAKLKEVFCGSAPLSRHLWNEVTDWCGGAAVRNLYGITETGSWIAGSPRDGAPADGLVGYPWGASFEIMAGGSPIHAPSRTEPNKQGAEGHIWVKTASLMKGYLDREDLTSEKIVDGWFSTGDIGLFDAQGRLYLKGRERDEINRGGIKIYPADVEAVVSSHRAVSEACCFAFDDSHYGQSVAVALVMDQADPATLKNLYTWTTERLAEHRVPAFWFLLDNIPKTDRGKIYIL